MLAGRAPAPDRSGVAQVLLRHEMQAVFRTDIDASIAQDAFAAVVDRMDMAVQTALALRPCVLGRKARFYFGDSAAPLQRHDRDLARDLLVARGPRITVGGQLLDFDVHPRL